MDSQQPGAMARVVTGLRKENFNLYEEDKKQEFRYFSEEDAPFLQD
jgi:hypothetical protein